MIVIYRADNGEILRVVSAPDDEAGRNTLPGESHILADSGPDWTTQYVSAGAIVAKPPSPVTLDAHSSVLHNCPVPALIVIQSATSRQVFYSEAADQPLSFAYPGTYTIWVRSFPYIDAQFSYTKT